MVGMGKSDPLEVINFDMLVLSRIRGWIYGHFSTAINITQMGIYTIYFDSTEGAIALLSDSAVTLSPRMQQLLLLLLLLLLPLLLPLPLPLLLRLRLYATTTATTPTMTTTTTTTATATTTIIILIGTTTRIFSVVFISLFYMFRSSRLHYYYYYYYFFIFFLYYYYYYYYYYRLININNNII